MISVLMSVYYKEKPEYLARALDSILAQSEPVDEIVLVEDGPLTAQLENVIAGYAAMRGTDADTGPVRAAGAAGSCEHVSPGSSCEHDSAGSEDARLNLGEIDAGTRPQLRVVRLAENQGLGPALATGMKACRGDLIARMDTDDIADKDRIKLQKAYMREHPEISAVGGDICEFVREEDLGDVVAAMEAADARGMTAHAAVTGAGQAGNGQGTKEQADESRIKAAGVDESQIKSKITGDGKAGDGGSGDQGSRDGVAGDSKAEDACSYASRGLRIKHMPTGSGRLYRYGRFRNPLNHMTVMLRRADIEAVGGYRKRPLLEDYDLWSRLLAKGYQIDNIPEVLVYARLGEGFSARRGGFAYFKEYAKLRWMQLRIGYLHGWEYLAAMAATAGMTLVPADLRGKMYEYLRRR